MKIRWKTIHMRSWRMWEKLYEKWRVDQTQENSFRWVTITMQFTKTGHRSLTIIKCKWTYQSIFPWFQAFVPIPVPTAGRNSVGRITWRSIPGRISAPHLAEGWLVSETLYLSIHLILPSCQTALIPFNNPRMDCPLFWGCHHPTLISTSPDPITSLQQPFLPEPHISMKMTKDWEIKVYNFVMFQIGINFV